MTLLQQSKHFHGWAGWPALLMCAPVSTSVYANGIKDGATFSDLANSDDAQGQHDENLCLLPQVAFRQLLGLILLLELLHLSI